MKYKLLIPILFLFLLISSVYAGDIGTVNQPIILWADIMNGTNYLPGTTANITIKTPTYSTIINNSAMTQLQTGAFYYNFTPNETGVYYTYSQFYSGVTLLGTASSTFYITQDVDMALAIMLGLIAITSFFLYMGFDLIQKQPLPIFGPGFEKIKINDLGLFFLMLSFPMVNISLAVMQKMAIGTTYYNLISIIFQISIYITILAISLYTIFYIIMRNIAQTKNILSLQKAGRHK